MFRQQTDSQETLDEQFFNFGGSSPGDIVRSSAAMSSRHASFSIDTTDFVLAQGHVRSFPQSAMGGSHISPPQDIINSSQRQDVTLYEPWRVTQSSDPSLRVSATFMGQYLEHPNFLQRNQDGEIFVTEMVMKTSPKLPPSLSTLEDRINDGPTGYTYGFPPQMLPDGSHHFSPLMNRQPSPSDQFSHPSSGTEVVGALRDDEDTEMCDASLAMTTPPQVDRPYMSECLEQFRFRVTLNAQTAMVKRANEIPVTYLNKGQQYSITIVDTSPMALGSAPVKCRTTIFISFDDPQQRGVPAACWRLWIKGRGADEAHQHGGKLQAVEYMEVTQSRRKGAVAELESAAFNRFSVLWSPGLSSSASCKVRVRFNFLSTDFSLSKGVKGMASRICAKTEVLSVNPVHSSLEFLEICFCKVKIFRDHGAERKIANDIKHVRNAIDRLKERISSAETRTMGPGKRRGSESAVKSGPSRGLPSKVLKRERTWSASSAFSTGELAVAEENAQSQIQTLLNMLNSTLPISTLNLHGEEQDVPNFHLVHATTESRNIQEVFAGESGPWPPLNPLQLAQTRGQIRYSSYSTTTRSILPLLPTVYNQSRTGLQQSGPQPLLSITDQPVRVQRKCQQDSSSAPIDWIEALDVNPTYRPPPALSPKPAACFYVLRHDDGDSDPIITTSPPHHYRAIYLQSRDAQELTSRIAAKFGIGASRVCCAVRIDGNGRRVLVDDDVVRQMPDGQDMGLRIGRVREGDGAVCGEGEEREWDGRDGGDDGYEFRLFF